MCKNAYNPKPNYYYINLWAYVNLLDLVVESAALLPRIVEAACTNLDPGNCQIEISVQSLIELHTIHFMYFMLLARRWPSDAETYCQIKDTTLNICVEGNVFLLL